MSRDKLIRAHFEAYSDLQWVTNLEPQFRQYNPDASELKGYREAWNRHTKARDWAWWQDKAKSMSDAELHQEIAGCRAEIDAFRKGRSGDRERFQRILDGKEASEPLQHAVKDLGREM